jgi:hypothetical protein
MLARMSQAVALSMEASKSLARRRLRPSHAEVRSTTHLRGKSWKPLTPAGPQWLMAARNWGAPVDAIGENVTQLGEASAQRSEQRHRAIRILKVGRVDLAGDHEAFGVSDDVALAALDPLAGVYTTRTTAFRGRRALAVDDAR